MTDLERFAENCAAGYQNTRGKVSWKVVGDRLHYQGSVEPEDWERNFLVIPVPWRIRGVWCWISLGVLLAWLATRRQALASGAAEGAGYSAGGPPIAIWSAVTGLPAVAFGCPRFLWRPSLAALHLFNEVRFVDSPLDIVPRVPPWAERGDRVYTLGGAATCPDGYDRILWATGHSTEEYRQRLAAE
jgi:hypothetical protein